MRPREGEAVRERPRAAEIEAGLLEALRTALDAPALHFAEPPTLLGDGATARAFALRLAGAPAGASGPLVCRVFCSGEEGLSADQATLEAALQNALAGAGFRAPRAFAAGGAGSSLGLPFLVMERIAGANGFPVVLVALAVGGALELVGARGALAAVYAGVWMAMARVLRRLHRVPGREVEAALVGVGLSPDRFGLDAALDALAAAVEPAGPPGARAVLGWLRTHRPAPADPPTVCHGDFWFGNLLVSRRGVALLDWTQAGIGHRELDLGWMSIQHYSRTPLAVPDPLFDWLWLPVRPFSWLLMAPIRFVYRLGGGVDPARLRWFTVFCALRELVRCAALERHAPGATRPAELRAWGSRHTRGLLRRCVRRITGIDPG